MNIQNNEPNLFIIVQGEGKDKKYYNGLDHKFYSDLANASYASNNKEAQKIISFLMLPNSQVVKIKESEFVHAKANAMTKITIIAETLSIYIRDNISTLPNKSQVMKNAHKHLKNAAESIKGLNPDFEHYLKSSEDDVYDVQGFYEEFIHEIASISFYELVNLVGLLKAYKEDSKSIIGIARKVLKTAEDKKKEKLAQKNQLSILDQPGA